MGQNKTKKPKVSIWSITYNHAPFLKDFFEGILKQKTDFSYELIIGDDASTDGSKDIIEAYQKEYPDIIKPIFQNKNVGIYENSIVSVFPKLIGEYIAFCEGDDYWIDENKLQKQVDFLEINPGYGGVSTNNRWFIEKENIFNDCILAEGSISFEDLSESNQINSQTILFRKSLVQNVDWFKEIKIGDWALHLIVTNQQPYYRLPQITAVYRFYGKGVHSQLNEEFKIRNRIEVLITILKHVDLTLKRKELVKASIRDLLKKLMNYNSKDLKTTRNKYFEYGGAFFNKTIFKSYIHELF